MRAGRLSELLTPPWLPRLAKNVAFRATLAAACLAVHLLAVSAVGRDRFGYDFNLAPGKAPYFAKPTDRAAQWWDRLIVSRWDSGTYVGLALRGYSECPKTSLRGVDLRPYLGTCNLAFYPGYPALGWLASLGGRLPVDMALLAVSLLASFLALFLWTGPTLVQRLGLGPTYASFLAFNGFTTGFSLVTIQTEPLTLLFTLGAFLALARRRLLLGACLAGAATALRVTALATGVAFGVALVAITIAERPADARAWARRALELLLCGWGVLVLMTYFGLRFGDPLIYLHAHAQAFNHHPSLLNVLMPPVEQVALSIDHPLHEGVWLAAALLWLGLGYREAVARFTTPERAFTVVLVVLCIGVAAYGTVDLGFAGMNRYLLLCLPVFFSIGALTARRPLVLFLWLALSTWHYRHIDACEFTGGPGTRTLQQCHAQHWIGRI